MDLKLLERLYKQESPSNFERPMSLLIQKELDKIGLSYNVDTYHQIFNLIPNTPLLVAHIDQHTQAPVSEVRVLNKTVRGYDSLGKRTMLGADDKNGVYIVLKLLSAFKDKVSFIFSTAEEVGGNIDVLLADDNDLIQDLNFALVFDRKGAGDIIGTKNEYCIKDLETDLTEVGKAYGYKSAHGIFSDADAISEYISCVNLSVGYHGAHTRKEFTVISELENALTYAADILNSIRDKKYEAPEKKFGNIRWYGHGLTTTSRWDDYELNNGYDNLADETDVNCSMCQTNCTVILFDGQPQIPQFCPFCGEPVIDSIDTDTGIFLT